MPYDDTLKDEIRHRIDLVDYIGRVVTLKKAGGTLKGLCPFHQEKTPSFNVNPDKQFYHCFGCGKGGDIFTFTMEHEGVDFAEALRILADVAGIDPEAYRQGGGGPRQDTGLRTQLYQVHAAIATWYQQNLFAPAGADALAYARDRGLSDELIQRFGLGYAPGGFDAARDWAHQHGYAEELMLTAGLLKAKEHESGGPTRVYDHFRHRLMFPIWNEQGRIIAFSGRKLREEDLGGKYVNSPETPIFTKGQVLYGLPLARESIRREGFAILCEGQMDVIACHAAGLTQAVAPQGTAFTENQARLLTRYAQRVVLCFDSDEAGQAAAVKASEVLLPAELTASVMRLGEGEDPDSVRRRQGDDALGRLLEQACDYFEFRLDYELAQRHPQDPEADGRAAHAFLELVERLPNKVSQGHYVELAARKLKLPAETVSAELKRIHQQRVRARRLGDRGAARDEPPPFPLAPRPQLTSNPEETALLGLFGLALQSEDLALRLARELPPTDLGQGPVATALAELLAYAEEGEWQEALDLLRDRLATAPVPALSRAFVAPEVRLEDGREKVERYTEDCLQRLRRARLQELLADVSRRYKAASPDEKAALWQEQRGLRDELRKLAQAPGAPGPSSPTATNLSLAELLAQVSAPKARGEAAAPVAPPVAATPVGGETDVRM